MVSLIFVRINYCGISKIQFCEYVNSWTKALPIQFDVMFLTLMNI